MFERARSWTGAEVAFFGLVLAGAVALALSWPEPLPRFLVGLDILALLVRLRPISPRFKTSVERTGWVLLGLTGVFAFAWSLYPVIPEPLVRTFPRIAGYGLALLSTLFLVGRSQWEPRRTLIPAAVGVLVVAGLDPVAPLRLPVVVAVVSVVGGLALDAARNGAAGLVRLLLFALVAASGAVAIVAFLPLAQPLVENAAAKFVDSHEGESGFSLESRLGEVDELHLSPRVLMHVTTSAPGKLRAAVYTHFDGMAWHVHRPRPQPLLVESAAIGGDLGDWLEGVPGRVFAVPGAFIDRAGRADAVRTRIVEVSPVLGALPAPAGVWLVRRTAEVVVDSQAGTLGPAMPGLELYGVVSAPPGTAIPASDDQPMGELLELPTDLDPRLRALADGLRGEGSPSVETLVGRTVAYVRDECHYSLKPGRFRTRQPVAEFLFDKKKGYCEYFATAALVLLRLQGVKTRYVRGFSVRDENFAGGHFVVREADAHAWIEALVPGRGFIEADPTPAAEYAAAHGVIEHGGLASVLAWIDARWSELRALVSARAAGTLLSRIGEAARDVARSRAAVFVWAAALLPAAWLARRLWRLARLLLERWSKRRLAKAGRERPELDDLLAHADRVWARRGRRRAPAQTPLEYLSSLPEDALPVDLLLSSKRAIAAYYRGRFAGDVVPAAELQRLHTGLDTRPSRGGRE